MHHKNSIISNFLMGGFLALSLAACEGKPTDPYPPPTAAEPGMTTTIPPFPWPPGRASAQSEIPSKLLTSSDGDTTLSDVGGKLEEALRIAEYRKWSYSSVPNGFALVTQLEQIKPDGYPKAEPERWSADLPSLSDLSLLAFVKALAIAPEGSYRVIVFIVTNAGLKQTGEKPTEEQAQKWLWGGGDKLPAPLGKRTYGKDFKTTALIYEFRKRSKTDATLVPDSEVRGVDHLVRAGIYVPLSR